MESESHTPSPEQPVEQPATQAAAPAEQFMLPQRRPNDRRLFQFGLVAVGVLCIYFALSWQEGDVTHLYQGLAILVLACLPSLQWAYRGDASFPLMEAFLLTTATSYAAPLLTGHEALLQYSDQVIFRSANIVIVYQVAAILTFNLVQAYPRTTPFWTREVISEGFGRFLSYGMALTTLYTFGQTFFYDTIFDRLPRESEGVLRAAFFGLGIICTFVTCRRWGLGQLQQQERISFGLNLALQVVIISTSLYLINAISLLVLAALGYISGSRRLPTVLIAALLPVLAILHHGKTAMREKYWDREEQRQVTVTEVPAFYLEWIGHGLEQEPEKKASKASLLLERTSLLQILCLVVDRTPEKQDYLWGETYRYIPGQFIPRFFWPDKPVGHISTYKLSVYYGLQREEDTKSTTIAFGTLSEAYANFGMVGAVLLAVVMGSFFKIVSVWTRNSPMLSYGGLLLVILMAWSFQGELTLAIWLSSLFQACVAVLGIPLLIRSLFQ